MPSDLLCNVVGGDLHSLSLDEIEDVSLGGGGDVQPDAGHQVSQGSASWEVRAPPDVQPSTQHLYQINSSVSVSNVNLC